MKSAECLVGVSLPKFDIVTQEAQFNVNTLKGKKTILCFWESRIPSSTLEEVESGEAFSEVLKIVLEN